MTHKLHISILSSLSGCYSFEYKSAVSGQATVNNGGANLVLVNECLNPSDGVFRRVLWSAGMESDADAVPGLKGPNDHAKDIAKGFEMTLLKDNPVGVSEKPLTTTLSKSMICALDRRNRVDS